MTQIAEITLKQLPERKMLAIRRTIDFFGEYAEFMGETIKELMKQIQQAGLLPASGPIVCFHNVDLSALDLEIGFEISAPISAKGEAVFAVLPVQTVAVTIDRGPYEAQDPTLEALMSWITEKDFITTGGIYYHYLNDESQPPNEYLTEMYIPLKVRS
ncbi:GyrI-like domain-containing protein [Enterococcus sp. LJL128]